MTNIVNFRTRTSAKSQTRIASVSPLLASLARGLDQIGQTEFKSKEDLQGALFFLALSNLHVRHFIGHITDDECRTRMLDQTNRIDELVEDAGRKAAAL
jgi:hypothetical protein